MCSISSMREEKKVASSGELLSLKCQELNIDGIPGSVKALKGIHGPGLRPCRNPGSKDHGRRNKTLKGFNTQVEVLIPFREKRKSNAPEPQGSAGPQPWAGQWIPFGELQEPMAYGSKPVPAKEGVVMKRRDFLKSTVVGTAGLSLGTRTTLFSQDSAKPALLGGKPVRTNPFPPWPMIADNDEKAWMECLRAKHWFRMDGNAVSTFEKEFARLMGTKDCLATANGTSALLTSLNALGIGPGDEVIVPPYTFVATINVVLLQFALPIFVDTDPETFQIDAKKLESAITEKTRCIIPVHLGGGSADLDAILGIAKKHKLPVIEDACQSHLAEWRGRKLGSWGDAGCFSFQVSKNLCSGEGGAIISDNTDLVNRCYVFHTNGAERKPTPAFSYRVKGTNVRMTEFQGTLLLQQMTRLEKQSRLREENAAYLTDQLKKIQGIRPAQSYAGCTRNAYHLYMFRYDKSRFAGLDRKRFLAALEAEGIPCSAGYSPLNKEPFLKSTLYSRGYQQVYSKQGIDQYFKSNDCPENDRLCEEAVWFTQNMLLGSRGDMDQIAEGIRKISRHASELSKT